ncbi:MAG: hypothetical protein ACI81S_001578 [Sphingobacteriales bacterium]|jgi:hypothetical protein
MENVIIIFTAVIAASSTFYASTTLKMGPVRASALLSLIVALFFNFFDTLLSPELTKVIPIVFFGASFLGMVSPKVLSNYRFLALGGFLFSLIFINTSFFFQGFGGALGTSANIAVLISFALFLFFKQRTFKKDQE